MWMVGTAEYQVGRGGVPRAAWKAAGEKGARHATLEPAAHEPSIDAERPPMWKSGMAFKQT